MHYLVMDLEWNNVYTKKLSGFFNEIIEIGAVLLDDDLREIDRFSTFVRAQQSKKLHKTIKQLTHITYEDLADGMPFNIAMTELRRWIGSEPYTVLTWGDSDVRVLIENYRYLNGQRTVPLLTRHADLQKYFQSRVTLPSKNQISLANAAAVVEIDDSAFSHHRALDDSLLTAEIFRKVYDPAAFSEYVRLCNSAFYGRLSFKPHYIGTRGNPDVQRVLSAGQRCDICNGKVRQLTEWKYSGHFFRAMFYCPKCERSTRVSISFRKLYDRIEIKRTSLTVQEQENTDRQNVE